MPLNSPTSEVQKPALHAGKLLQVLGIWFGIAAAIGNTIAAGIVAAPGDIAKWLPNPWLFLGVWLLGGMYAMFGASSLAELGAAIPRSGGQYNYAHRAIGEYAGFVVGWGDWLSTCGSMALVGIVIGEYAGKLIGVLDGHEKWIAVCVIVGFALLQWRGVRSASNAQLITSATKTLAFLVLVMACFLLGGPAHAARAAADAAPLAPSTGWPLAVGLMLALQAVFFTIDGWDGVIYFGEEVRDPGRDIPRAIFGSVFSVIGIYVLINAAVLYVLPMSAIAGNNFSLGTAASVIFGRYGDPIVRGIMVISMLSCINALQLFCCRILYAMSSDGLFFRRASRVNAGGTPTTALLLSTIVGVLFALGSFERLIAMLSFFFVVNYALSYTSLFILRFREPAMARPYRAWGYPWTTAIALAGSIVFLVSSILADRKNAPLALALVVASLPIFLIMKRFAPRPADKPA